MLIVSYVRTVCTVLMSCVYCMYCMYTVCTLCTVCTVGTARMYCMYCILYWLYCLFCMYCIHCMYCMFCVCSVCTVHCRGKYGTVYKGRSKVSGQECAIKVIKKIKMDRKDVRREVRIIQKILDNPHRNIVRLMDWFETRREYVIVTEL